MNTRITKNYEAIVTMQDNTEVAFDVEVDYYDEDGFCIPEIGVNITPQEPTTKLTGHSELHEDDILDALDTWFTKDCANTADEERLFFQFDSEMLEVSRIGDIPQVEDPQPSIEKALEQIKKDIANGDLTAIEELLKLTPLSIVKGYLGED